MLCGCNYLLSRCLDVYGLQEISEHRPAAYPRPLGIPACLKKTVYEGNPFIFGFWGTLGTFQECWEVSYIVVMAG